VYYQNELDETLVLLTLAGDQSAYEKLVVRYQTTVVASAASITRNHSLAEDAAQDAFVTAWMKLNTLQEPQKFGAWVCRIAKNCAINMIHRYREFLPLDVVDNLNLDADNAENPATLYEISEERREIRESVEALPQKVQAIIRMHYFEGLSIVEIADKLRISEGTVKWQLHDGRKRIRKELCAMNEKYSDTLVQKVMKKVEELKLWQLRNDKSGFEDVYRDVLREVEELPESQEKNHALADVLMRGWWWLPGKKNDELMKRITDAAIEGKNEEVMTFIVSREDNKVYGGAKIEFIRDKQIPRLEELGFTKTLGREYFWLGYYCCDQGKPEEGRAAYDKVEEILEKDDPYRLLVPSARKLNEILSLEYREKQAKQYLIVGSAAEYRKINQKLCFWKGHGFGEGELNSVDRDARQIFRNACRCDGNFFADLSLGETFVGTDGTELSYISDSETVNTPAGVFEGCQLWVTTPWGSDGKSMFKTYYKEGVGIVKQVHTAANVSDTYTLKSYQVKTPQGLLPMNQGNTWEYASSYDPEFVASELIFTVSFADEEKIILSSWENMIRHKYDESSWLEMISQIRCDYWEKPDPNSSYCRLADVTPAIERAEALATTPMEKAHTKAAASVARRILATDPNCNPDYTATGHWNFFSKNAVQKKQDSLRISHHFRWSFEWKNTGSFGIAEDPILYNDIYGILQDATNCIWSDEWRIGASPLVEYTLWSNDITTQITCEDGGTIKTKAGTFENCLKICLDIGGMSSGLSYRGGKKAYYFAEGIGIVRTENMYAGDIKTAVYELTSYEGTGEGYMPIADGLVRRYDAIGLTDGFVGAAEYTYVADEEGDIVIFSDRTGIREIPAPITQYSAIQSEMMEEILWDKKERAQTHTLHALNNVHLMLHYLGRPTWNRGNPDRSIGMCEYKKKLLKLFGDDEVPPAWCGTYGWFSLIQAAALFGKGEKEKGYASLDEAYEHYKRWSEFSEGDELSVGNPFEFGNVKYIKGKSFFVDSNGEKSPTEYDYRIETPVSHLYGALTARNGWEWFNSVRAEDRFREYVDKAKALADKKD